MLSDDRKTTAGESRLLARALPGADLTAYRRNRNDYHGYNEGRDAVDTALRAALENLDTTLAEIGGEAWRASREAAPTYSREADRPAGRERLARLSLTLTRMAKHAADLADVVDLRIGDDAADADLNRYVDTLMARQA